MPLQQLPFENLSPNSRNHTEDGGGNTGLISGKDEEEEELIDEKNNVEELKKPIDDVYDVNAVKPQYELQCLRKEWIIDYMQLMEMNG